jgi:hypothetical protein
MQDKTWFEIIKARMMTLDQFSNSDRTLRAFALGMAFSECVAGKGMLRSDATFPTKVEVMHFDGRVQFYFDDLRKKRALSPSSEVQTFVPQPEE